MAHNPKLADKQGLDELSREIIDALHVFREALEIVASGYDLDHEEGKDKLNLAYGFWFKNEQLLQKLWKFPENTNYIKFWDFPKCACPKLDNDDNYPTGYYITSEKCPIHGWSDNENIAS